MKCAILALLLPALASAAEVTLLTEQDLKAALYDVLSHGDLFDVAYVSRKLDLGAHVRKPEVSGTFSRSLVIPTRNPSVLYGSFLEYYVDVRGDQKISTAHLRLSPRSCLPLSRWAAEWGLENHQAQIMDAFGTSEGIVWPGAEGISLGVTQVGGGCDVEIAQSVHRVVDILPSPSSVSVPPDELAHKIGDLLSLKDLRNYNEVARVLDAELIAKPDSLREGLLYDNGPQLGHVIRGFEPFLSYSANDKGWDSPGAIVYTPPHLTDRTVDLSLTVDVDSVCLSQAQLASELKRRGDIIGAQRNSDGSVYRVRGGNMMILRAGPRDGCIAFLTVKQVTDVAHSVGRPVLFEIPDSLDEATGSLTDEARQKIEAVVGRLASVSLGGIEVVPMPGSTKHPSERVRRDLASLEQLVKAALLRSGVDVDKSKQDDSSPYDCHTLQTDRPGLCLDAWL